MTSGHDDGETPWSRFRQLAYGVLRWTPQAFAAATLRDLVDGLEGWREAHGFKRPGQKMSRTRLDELKELYG